MATGDGFGLSEAAQRRAGAVTLDEQFPDREIRPSDVQLGADSVSLTENIQREVAADRFEDQTALRGVNPDTYLRETDDGGFALGAAARQRLAARNFEDQFDEFSRDDLTARDVRGTGSGFVLRDRAQRRLGAERIDDQLPEVTVTSDDVTIEDGQAVFEREVPR